MSGFMDGGVVINSYQRNQGSVPVTSHCIETWASSFTSYALPFERVPLSGVYARGRKETIPHLEMGKSFCGEIE